MLRIEAILQPIIEWRRTMRSAFHRTLAAALLLAGAASPAWAGDIGVVLLHGKTSAPKQMAPLARTLGDAGVLTVSPEGAWSKRRIYDAAYLDALKQVDAAVAELRRRGATEIYLAGQSQGANVALGYAARRSGIAGIALLAPGHAIGFDAITRKSAKARARAQRLIDKGLGDKPVDFTDLNQGEPVAFRTTPRIYLSWTDPTGPAALKTNAAALPDGLAVFCVDGSREPHPRCKPIMAKVMAHPRKRSIVVEADHKGVPRVAGPALLAWLTGR